MRNAEVGVFPRTNFLDSTAIGEPIAICVHIQNRPILLPPAAFQRLRIIGSGMLAWLLEFF
ncbi:MULTISPECIES: hypothetical protein [unclassified Mesorhizobium]|uniref:hypothetical protein n=1 Tax=unclassified Mesorhizobium TaxID=325217 RepID=UPI000AE743CF|nr:MULTISPECIES: hypothetical protein [unclassified Mesorhizobium]WJI76940.1 hypothetical protein NLY37_09670 [Mesorhizobium sp. C395A]